MVVVGDGATRHGRPPDRELSKTPKQVFHGLFFQTQPTHLGQVGREQGREALARVVLDLGVDSNVDGGAGCSTRGHHRHQRERGASGEALPPQQAKQRTGLKPIAKSCGVGTAHTHHRPTPSPAQPLNTETMWR
jgi:hypothetical protein